MDDLRSRFATLDRVRVPELWPEIEVRAAAVASVAPATRIARPINGPRPLTRRSMPRLVALVALLALVGATVAVGTGLVKLPSILPSPSTPPPSQATESPFPSTEAAWMTGQELMDVLTAAHGYAWSELSIEFGHTVFVSEGIQVESPFDGPATLSARVSLDAAEGDRELHATRVVDALAPDASTWLRDAIAAHLEAGPGEFSSTRTASGGEVSIAVVGEPDLEDHMLVRFAGAPLPRRTLTTDASGLVAYVDDGRVWVVDPDGSAAGILPAGEAGPDVVEALLGWSPDGARLFYVDAGDRLWILDADGSTVFVGDSAPDSLCPPVVEADNCQASLDGAAISPDGTRLAYRLLEGGDLEISTVAIFDLTTSTVRRLDATRSDASGECDTAQSGTIDSVAWSPDGTQLAFGRQGMGPPDDELECQYSILTIDVGGGDPRRLTPPGIAALVPRWSPDASRIAFHTQGSDVYTVRPDGSALVRLTSDERSAWPFWTRDGRLVYARWDGAVALRLWIMDADGGNVTRIETTVAAQSAAGCVVCPGPDDEGRLASVDPSAYRHWQPIPGGEP